MTYNDQHRLTDPVLSARLRLALDYEKRGNPQARGMILYVHAIVDRRISQDLDTAEQMVKGNAEALHLAAARAAQLGTKTHRGVRETLRGITPVKVETLSDGRVSAAQAREMYGNWRSKWGWPS